MLKGNKIDLSDYQIINSWLQFYILMKCNGFGFGMSVIH